MTTRRVTARAAILIALLAAGAAAQDVGVPVAAEPSTAAPSAAAPAALTPAERRCALDLAPLDYTAPLHRSLRATRCVAEGWRRPSGEVLLSTRRGVPDGRGNGAAIAAVGATWQLRMRTEYQRGPLLLRFAPEVHRAQNAPFVTFPAGDSTRSGQSSPWYFGPHSADLPSRHGSAPLTQLDLGESGAWLSGRQWIVGATTALPDWGPGIGEGLVLGRSAAGLPRLEASWRQSLSRARAKSRDAAVARDGRPASEASAAPSLDLRWFAGAALESRYFDTDPENNLRGVAGLRLALEAGRWQVGLSRTVMDGRRDRAPLGAALLPLQRSASDSLLETLAADLRFADAARGSLLWLELARQAPLRSAQDFLLLPTEGLAMRAGASQVLARSARAQWIVGFEAVRLSQPPQRSTTDDRDFYTSPTVVHGWTHRGEPLGSGLGPGGERQLLSLDREAPAGDLGVFLERVRWNDDALYRQYLPYLTRHDVTLQGGLRAGWRSRALSWRASLSGGQRLNYLFQNADWIPGFRSDDAGVLEFSLSITPR
jgi:hypothetical protein